MEIALSRFCGVDDIVSPLSKKEEAVRFDFSGINAQNYLAPFWKYSLYDVLRCTWYKYLKGYYDHIPAREVKSYLSPETWNSYFKFAFDRNPWDKVISYFYWSGADIKYPDIESFLKSENVEIISSFEQLSIGGVLAVDKIFKFENLESALVEITDILGLSEKLTMPSYKAKGGYRIDDRDYKELLTDKEAELISTMFAREIKIMGYQF